MFYRKLAILSLSCSTIQDDMNSNDLQRIFCFHACNRRSALWRFTNFRNPNQMLKCKFSNISCTNNSHYILKVNYFHCHFYLTLSLGWNDASVLNWTRKYWDLWQSLLLYLPFNTRISMINCVYYEWPLGAKNA